MKKLFLIIGIIQLVFLFYYVEKNWCGHHTNNIENNK